MEIIAFGVACFLIWRVIDSLSSKSSIEKQATRRTVITDTPKGKSVVVELEETVKTFDENRAIARPASTQRFISTQLPSDSLKQLENISELSFAEEPIVRDWGVSPTKIDTYQTKKGRAMSEQHAQEKTSEQPKVCGKCNKNLPQKNFFNSKNGGLSAWCKDCHARSSKQGESRHYKVCPKCNSRRLRTNFGRSEKNPDGLTKWCLPCLKKVS